jgi:DNA (cytosine-5)-methyltransferase 1
MTFGSLFAGIGGFDLGFERAGLRCLWQVEINAYCQEVLARRFPLARRWDDAGTFARSGLMWHTSPRPDVICGGPPCQRTSVAAAIQGVRTGATLWPEMRRVCQVVRPAWVVVEQPAGNRAWEKAVAGDLARIGYQYSRLELSARGGGAPHQRRRVFFIAHALRERCEAVAGVARSSAATAEPWPAPPRGTWRTPGPRDRGVDDGLSGWVDRLTALGNSVVPHKAELIGRALMEHPEPA